MNEAGTRRAEKGRKGPNETGNQEKQICSCMTVGRGAMCGLQDRSQFCFYFHFSPRSPCESKLIVTSEVKKNLIAGSFAICLRLIVIITLAVFTLRSR